MAEQSAKSTLLITVVRSGGFAGLRSEWHVEPTADEQPDWVVLVEACPWGAVGTDPASRDRYVWSIEARMTRRVCSATVPEREMTGAWKTLVDRVREAQTPSTDRPSR